MKVDDLILKHEGYRRFVYRDTVGKLTVGIGRNLEDRGLTSEEALYLLNNDIKDFEKQLSDRLYWFNALPEGAKIVLIDMAFNLGIGGLMQFRNTLEHIKNGQYSLAAADMLDSKWAKQVGIRATELAEILKNTKI